MAGFAWDRPVDPVVKPSTRPSQTPIHTQDAPYVPRFIPRRGYDWRRQTEDYCSKSGTQTLEGYTLNVSLQGRNGRDSGRESVRLGERTLLYVAVGCDDGVSILKLG